MSGRRNALIVGPVGGADGGRSPGGVAAHVSDIARELAHLGWRVGVYADNVPEHAQSLEREWGPLYVRPPLDRSPASALRMLAPARAAAAKRVLSDPHVRGVGQSAGVAVAHVLGVRSAVRDFAPDVVHYHQPDWRPLYGRLAGVESPGVVTVHSLSRLAPDQPTGMDALVLENLREADAVIVVSADLQAGLAEAAPDVRTTVVANGIELGRFADVGGRASDDRPTVLFVGRVVPEKGVEVLLEAAAKAQTVVPGLRLLVAGPNPAGDLAELAASAGLEEGVLEYVGAVDEDEVPGLLARATVLAFPSLFREGQGRSAIEAQAAGVPVVGSAVGGVPDVLRGGEAGLLVRPGDAGALADALVRAMTDQPLRAKLIAAGRDSAQRFSLPVVTAKIAAVYASLAGDDSASAR